MSPILCLQLFGTTKKTKVFYYLIFLNRKLQPALFNLLLLFFNNGDISQIFMLMFNVIFYIA